MRLLSMTFGKTCPHWQFRLCLFLPNAKRHNVISTLKIVTEQHQFHTVLCFSLWANVFDEMQRWKLELCSILLSYFWGETIIRIQCTLYIKLNFFRCYIFWLMTIVESFSFPYSLRIHFSSLIYPFNLSNSFLLFSEKQYYKFSNI